MSVIDVSYPLSHAAAITINRPERRNALRSEDIAELTAVLREVATNAALHMVILTGNGAFCAGADLSSLTNAVQAEPPTPAMYGPPHALIGAIVDQPIPIMAALDGPAVGMGADIALACDSRLIGEQGWIQQGWAARGAIPATGGWIFLDEIAPGSIWKLIDGQPRLNGPLAQQYGIGEAVENGFDAAVARAERYGSIPRATLEAYVELNRTPRRERLQRELPAAAEWQAKLFSRREFVDGLQRNLTSVDDATP